LTPHLISFEQAIKSLESQFLKSKIYFGHGAESAYSEALWIFSHLMGQSPSNFLKLLNNNCPNNLIANAKKIADERINKRIPLAYILNEAWLMGYSFYADPRSIIPRSFIAELIIDGTLEPWLPENAKVLDLCTGNASLAIIMSLTYPDVNLSAADISEQALALAAKNLIRHKLSRKIALFQGDLYSALPLPTEENRFNLIICNPPYVNDYSMQNLPPEFLAEPHISLAGGHKGMDLIKKILSQSKLYLKKNGAVLLEIGHEFDNFCEVFPNINFTALDVSSSHNSVLLVSFEDLP